MGEDRSIKKIFRNQKVLKDLEKLNQMRFHITYLFDKDYVVVSSGNKRLFIKVFTVVKDDYLQQRTQAQTFYNDANI